MRVAGASARKHADRGGRRALERAAFGMHGAACRRSFMPARVARSRSASSPRTRPSSSRARIRSSNRATHYTIVGKPTPRFDIPSKVNGSATFGIDVTLPRNAVRDGAAAPVFGAQAAVGRQQGGRGHARRPPGRAARQCRRRRRGQLLASVERTARAGSVVQRNARMRAPAANRCSPSSASALETEKGKKVHSVRRGRDEGARRRGEGRSRRSTACRSSRTRRWSR